MLPDR